MTMKPMLVLVLILSSYCIPPTNSFQLCTFTRHTKLHHEAPFRTSLNLFNYPTTSTNTKNPSSSLSNPYKNIINLSNNQLVPLSTVHDQLSNSNVTLPYTILLQKDETSETIQGVKRIINGDKLPSSSSSSSKQKLIIIRQLEENDVPTAVRMTVKEYGSYPSSSSSPFETIDTKTLESFKPILTFIQEQYSWFENFTLSFIVGFGLTQRVRRRVQSERDVGLPQDHNVICISEVFINDDEFDTIIQQQRSKALNIKSRNGKNSNTLNDNANNMYEYLLAQRKQETLIGMAEVSLQPLIPQRTAPPFVIPLWAKYIIASLSPSKTFIQEQNNIAPQQQEESTTKETQSHKLLLVPYISNVLIDPQFRGNGYSKLLMLCCEGLIQSWGFTKSYLHVEADIKNGAVPQNLYEKLGYDAFVSNGNAMNGKDDQFSWMTGPEIIKSGLYIVDGLPLLYLYKEL